MARVAFVVKLKDNEGTFYDDSTYNFSSFPSKFFYWTAKDGELCGSYTAEAGTWIPLINEFQDAYVGYVNSLIVGAPASATSPEGAYVWDPRQV